MSRDMDVRAWARRLMVVALLSAAAPSLAWAKAGVVLFVYGRAHIETAEGTRLPAVRGQAVTVGDTVVTRANGRLQMRMDDGGLIALRPNSRFLIEGFRMARRKPARSPETRDGEDGRGRSRGPSEDEDERDRDEDDDEEEDSGSSFFALLKGGFRAITGAIGKDDEDGYRVRTPIATVGIRGTEYDVLLCQGDCQPLEEGGEPPEDGLYAGVVEGGIVLTNEGGELELGVDQFAYVPSSGQAPQRSQRAREVLGDEDITVTEGDEEDEDEVEGSDDTEGDGDEDRDSTEDSDDDSGGDEDDAGTRDDGTVDGDGTTDDDVVETTDTSGGRTEVGTGVSGSDSETGGGFVTQQPSVPSTSEDDSGEGIDLTSGDPVARSLAFSVSPFSGQDAFSDVQAAGSVPLEADTDRQLIRFDGDHPAADRARYEVGGASNTNTGYDPGTGIRWGRWSAGSATVTTASGSGSLDLSQQSLHWIVGPVQTVRPIIPTTGTLEFGLVGNTDPTDDQGNVGFLGSATLSADFTNQVVDATVVVSLDEQLWEGVATGLPIASDATFQGPFDDVTVSDFSSGSTPTVYTGSGSLSGFFTADPDGNIDGAGIAYGMEADIGGDQRSVSGAAAFRTREQTQQQSGEQAPPPP